MQITNDKIKYYLIEYWKKLLIGIGVVVTMKIVSVLYEMGSWYHLFVTIPYILIAIIFISVYLKFQKHQAFVLRGIRYHRKELFSMVAQHLKTRTRMACLSCGGENVNVRGITKFNIDAIEKPQKGGAALITAVLGCDSCGLIQQYNLPAAIFEINNKTPNKAMNTDA